MKLVKEAIENPVQNAINTLGPTADMNDVVEYCWDNYSSLTGWEESQKFDEGYFPEEIEELMDHYGLDYDDFSQEWGMWAEGEGYEY